jgi:hypothetical protein
LESEVEVGAWQVFHADIVQTLELTPEQIPVNEDAFERWTAQHPSVRT